MTPVRGSVPRDVALGGLIAFTLRVYFPVDLL
jgi:hypothetical protein